MHVPCSLTRPCSCRHAVSCYNKQLTQQGKVNRYRRPAADQTHVHHNPAACWSHSVTQPTAQLTATSSRDCSLQDATETLPHGLHPWRVSESAGVCTGRLPTFGVTAGAVGEKNCHPWLLRRHSAQPICRQACTVTLSPAFVHCSLLCIVHGP